MFGLYFRAAAVLLPLAVLLLLPLQSAWAQLESNHIPQEKLQIIVTTRAITIGANFQGTDFYIAGVLENINPLLRRQNRYDIIAVLEGPSQDVLFYKKKRRLGIWVEDSPIKFSNVPQFYALAATRELRDITTPQTYKNLKLTADYLPIRPSWHTNPAHAEQARRALIQLQRERGLYTKEIGAINFGSSLLFSVQFYLPDNVPVGTYKVRAYLFRDGIYRDEAVTGLEISRKNMAYILYNIAQTQASWYGVAAVLIAVFIGFLGRLIFPK